MLAINAVRRASAVLRTAAPLSTWSAVPAGPPDPILGISEAFKADKDPRKINLGVGAYRDENGKPYVLNAVKKAEAKMAFAKLDKEYLPITGLANFTQNAAKLAYGSDSAPLNQNANYLSPTPTWGNHIPLFKDSGLEVRSYRYFDKKTVGLDFEGLKEDLKVCADFRCVTLPHPLSRTPQKVLSYFYMPVLHNPTGVDPTPAQWKELSDILAEKKLFPFFDMAYQGFASGSTTRDAFAVRHFVSQGHNVALCQSFAKNMGLYGERVGAFSLTTSSEEEKKRVESQLKIIVRPMYSNPPLHGAHIANTILSDPELYQEWESEVKGMADRIINMRERLCELFTNGFQTPGSWGHIESQIGMFRCVAFLGVRSAGCSHAWCSFTGLQTEQCRALAEKAHIYMTMDGRISMAGLNSSNIEYFAQSVDAAVRGNL
ncbi:pyridoxal phosphate-dependent transferase [Boletus reticuloceps]|uniref:Aspartate aminotransferase n=1 Tax=Boletus reticuloceps TaxID=495285 RepID=A0A8I2YXD5_9AGAM|nr:pyridoxal phosphate-dependent transferase [Boletus reticuloceps]